MICTQTTWGDITDNYNRTLNHLWTFIVSDQQLLIIILLLHLVCVLSTSTLLKQIIEEGNSGCHTFPDRTLNKDCLCGL